MAEPVFGSGVIIEMYVDPEYIPILCGNDCTFTRTPEIIETTSPSSGLWQTYMIRREGWTMNVSGLTKIDNDTALTFFYMLQTAVRRTEQTIRMTFTDIDGNDIQISGQALIGPQSVSGPATDFAQCSIEFQGSGAFTVEGVTPPTPIDYLYISDWWQTVNGQIYIDGPSSGETDGTNYTLLLTDLILEVDMEGIQYDLVSGTPTAGRRECHFQTSPARIIFPSDVVFDGNQRVFVHFKRPV